MPAHAGRAPAVHASCARGASGRKASPSVAVSIRSLAAPGPGARARLTRPAPGPAVLAVPN
eukprot:1283320-Alexandrium_andersonii.AAC.2